MAYQKLPGIYRKESPAKQTHEEIKKKAAKNDWEAGSTLEEGDYATYGQQAYDKKGNKTDFEWFEDTGT